MDRRWKLVLGVSAITIVTFTVLGQIGAPDWVLLTALVAWVAAMVVGSLIAHTGTEQTMTPQEAATALGVSEDKIGFLVADAVLKVQRAPGGKSWGITAASVERERRYRQQATPGRRLLRGLRRVLWWMP